MYWFSSHEACSDDYIALASMIVYCKIVGGSGVEPLCSITIEQITDISSRLS